MKRLGQNQHNPVGPVDEIAGQTAATAKTMGKQSLTSLLRRAVTPAAGALVAILLLAGLVGFAEKVATAKPPTNPRADAIVALTGGSARIDEALRLLADGHASRLLISGVNPSVTTGDLVGLVGTNLSAQLDCCVDLGREAIDTVSNATEAKQWANRNGFSSLIVVTSDYHMPRSMSELANAMPNIELTPYPVSNPDLRIGDWWRSPATFTLLVREYGKYLFARARQWLPTQTAASD